MTIEQRPWLLGLASLAAAFAIGCGDDDENGEEHGDEHGEEGAEAEACEHLANGPFAAITGGAADATDLPDAGIEHTSVDITLVEGDGGNEAFVSFAAEEDAEFLFFLDVNAPFAVFDGAGNEVEIEATEEGSEACTEIGVSYTLDLSVGTYTLHIGPTDATEVSLVHEEAGEEHDHEGEEHDHEGES